MLPMTANICNLYAEQGADWAIQFPVTNPDGSVFDLTGCTVAAQIRENASSPTSIQAFTVAIPAPTTGVVNLSLTHAQTAALEATGVAFTQLSSYVWECDLTTAAGSVARLLEGSFSLSPGGIR
jgi:hypothetical protein